MNSAPPRIQVECWPPLQTKPYNQVPLGCLLFLKTSLNAPKAQVGIGLHTKSRADEIENQFGSISMKNNKIASKKKTK
jgi:hypothetical protein